MALRRRSIPASVVFFTVMTTIFAYSYGPTQGGEAQSMAANTRRSRAVSEGEFKKKMSAGKWVSNPEFAQQIKETAVYEGPDDQMMVVGMGEKYATWMNWGKEFKKIQSVTPRGPHTVLALYQLNTADFLKLLDVKDRSVIVEASDDVALVDKRYPPLEGGRTFIQAVAEVGSRLIDWCRDLKWEIQSKQGIIVSASLLSSEKKYPLDAYLGDILLEQGSLKNYEVKGADYYANILKEIIKCGD